MQFSVSPFFSGVYDDDLSRELNRKMGYLFTGSEKERIHFGPNILTAKLEKNQREIIACGFLMICDINHRVVGLKKDEVYEYFVDGRGNISRHHVDWLIEQGFLREAKIGGQTVLFPTDLMLELFEDENPFSSKRTYFKARITGLMYKGTEEVQCDLECRVYARTGFYFSDFVETLIENRYVVLKHEGDVERYFLFTGSRLTEIKTKKEADHLGELLIKMEKRWDTSRVNAATDEFHAYRKIVEVGGGLAIYSLDGNYKIIIQASV